MKKYGSNNTDFDMQQMQRSAFITIRTIEFLLKRKYLHPYRVKFTLNIFSNQSTHSSNKDDIFTQFSLSPTLYTN